MEKYELGIYKKGEEDLGAADVLLTNASFDECFKAMSNKTLSDGEFYNIAEIDENGTFKGSSWKYDSNYNEIND